MQIGLIGCGNMARALARGWGKPMLCADPASGRADALVAELGSNRNAIYKTLFDARRKLRAALVTHGYLDDDVSRQP